MKMASANVSPVSPLPTPIPPASPFLQREGSDDSSGSGTAVARAAPAAAGEAVDELAELTANLPPAGPAQRRSVHLRRRSLNKHHHLAAIKTNGTVARNGPVLTPSPAYTGGTPPPPPPSFVSSIPSLPPPNTPRITTCLSTTTGCSVITPTSSPFQRVASVNRGRDHEEHDPDQDASSDPHANLLPLLSPVAHSAQHPPDKPLHAGQPRSLSGIAARAFCLGITLAVSAVLCLSLLALTSSPAWRLPFFTGALALFHFLEFYTTARYNVPAATVGAFLLTANWPYYALAHAFALAECGLVSFLWPDRDWAGRFLTGGWIPGAGWIVLATGLLLVVVGQTVRSAAMVQCGTSFNHKVQSWRRDGHALVTTGIYATLRHPSYFGFFWWALGTQLVLGNAVAFWLYAAVLWRFFSARVRHEELLLLRFFGDEYADYRRRTATRIPFIR